MRPRVLLLVLAAILIAALITLSIGDQFLVDLLWFGSLGYRSVFRTLIVAQVAVFAVVWMVAFVAILASGFAALGLSHDRERLRVVRRPDEMVEINLPELIRSLGERIPWKTVVILVAAILALFAAQGEAANWDTYLRAIYGVSFGISDPAYGRDIGFYTFSLPLLEELRGLYLLVLFLAAAVAMGVYWARGAIDLRESPPRIAGSVAGHLSVLLALFFIQRAFSYWVDRFGLLLHTNGVVFGLRYVDSVLWQPGLWLLVLLSLVAAGLCLANLRTGGARLLIAAAVIVFGPAILLSFIEPVIERLWVKPDELRVERPYLVRNIAMTRHAYQVDNVDVKPFKGHGQLTRASLAADAPTIKNIRIWDPRPLIATYRQLQEIRLYYDFHDVDIDRYVIQGRYTQVMLSPRELNPSLLPESAQTWVNQHLKFTHGNGLAMSPVNEKDSEGLPIFYVKDIPPSSSVGIRISQPGIYFGEEPDNYAVVDGASPEFDYPAGADNVFAYYSGGGGIPIAGLWRRLLFSVYYRDVNLLVTENIIAKSRILIRRNIRDRIATLAPFLNQDRDPYMVIDGGRLYWIADCYTVSDHYPYSQRNADQINYIRNSVKVVIDAYSGATDFYVADAEDPVIRTWQRIFPALFKPISAMPPTLRAHIRYPEDLFLIQADLYGTYHMTDPQVFYNREDQWGFPRENYGGETVAMQPYYVIMRLPGEAHEEYILMLPMVPHGRDNMIAWLAARCDGNDYGHLFEYAFSKESLFYGPYQIQARINQSPEISRQLSLWNQMGSKVILGNLIVIPIQNSLLYIEPLYIRAENGQLPELQRVIASYSDRVVMGDDLEQTLNALFIGAPPPPTPTLASVSPPPGAPAAANGAASGIKAASEHYDRALAAIKAGDWSQFGLEMQKLGEALGASGAPEQH
ncbi:MAG: UPF0182 family protein [Candidatus Binataceae bacterium]